MSSGSDSLLLVTHVALRSEGGRLAIDDQTAAGLKQWSKHFDFVTFIGIEHKVQAGTSSSSNWIFIDDLGLTGRCRVRALPRAYRPYAMMRSLSSSIGALDSEIIDHRNLCFTLGSGLGDWPAVAAHLAHIRNRRYTAWLDRVDETVNRQRLADSPFYVRSLGQLALPVIAWNLRLLLRRSTVTLLQGMDTYNYFWQDCSSPFCTYDTHTQQSDMINQATLRAKCASIMSGRPIQILYVGRAAPMKGPDDWLATLGTLSAQGVPFDATWIGDGPSLPSMVNRVASMSCKSSIRLSGFEGDRDRLMATYRASDVLLYCHKTAESPRCLIEALVSGCGLIGYESEYSAGITAKSGGGVFIKQGDTSGLAQVLSRMHDNRSNLTQLVQRAAKSGEDFDEDSVYAYRAKLMKLSGDSPI